MTHGGATRATGADRGCQRVIRGIASGARWWSRAGADHTRLPPRPADCTASGLWRTLARGGRQPRRLRGCSGAIGRSERTAPRIASRGGRCCGRGCGGQSKWCPCAGSGRHWQRAHWCKGSGCGARGSITGALWRAAIHLRDGLGCRGCAPKCHHRTGAIRCEAASRSCCARGRAAVGGARRPGEAPGEAARVLAMPARGHLPRLRSLRAPRDRQLGLDAARSPQLAALLRQDAGHCRHHVRAALGRLGARA
mmetsp:Transcript_80315/g.236255  ORF Transcript_80315/g.236255 Transcript_80315/m.236255 type:complete len:252 (-) Transcript_80315:143-898(-)